mgnify:FL=1
MAASRGESQRNACSCEDVYMLVCTWTLGVCAGVNTPLLHLEYPIVGDRHTESNGREKDGISVEKESVGVGER